MLNRTSDGKTITVTAGADVASGDFALIGTNIFGCAMNAVKSGGKAVYVTEPGVYEGVAKATGTAWVRGDVIYWDNTNKVFTKTSNSNTKVGVAWDDAASGDAVGNVKVGPPIG